MDSIKILIALIGSTFEVILGAVIFFILRIFFSIEVIGYYGVLTSFLLTFKFISDLGISMAYLKIYSDAKSEIEKTKCNGAYLGIRLIQLFIYFIIVLLLFSLFPIYNGPINIFFNFFMGYLFELINVYLFSYLLLSRKEVIKKSIGIIFPIIFKIYLILFLTNIFNSDLLLLSNIYLVSSLLSFFLFLFFLRHLKFNKPSLVYWKRFLNYSKPLILMSSLITVAAQIDVLMVNFWFSIEEVANFFTAKQLYSFLLFLLSNISLILISTFSKNITEGNEIENIYIIKKTHQLLNLFVVPLIFLISLFSTDLLVYIFGESYRLTGLLFSILTYKLIIVSNDLANEVQLNASGNIGFTAKKYIIESLLSLLLIILFISPSIFNLGPIGGVLAILSSSVIVEVIYRPILYKKFGLGFNWGFFRNFALMVLIFLLQFYINSFFSKPFSLIYIFIMILLDLFIYLSISYFLGGFSKADIKFVLDMVKYNNIKKTIFSELRNNEGG